MTCCRAVQAWTAHTCVRAAHAGDASTPRAEEAPQTSCCTAVQADWPTASLVPRRQVNGLDATAARTFGSLAAAVERRGVTLIIAHVPKRQMRKLLTVHGVIAPAVHGADEHGGSARTVSFPTLDAAVQVRGSLTRWLGLGLPSAALHSQAAVWLPPPLSCAVPWRA